MKIRDHLRAAAPLASKARAAKMSKLSKQAAALAKEVRDLAPAGSAAPLRKSAEGYTKSLYALSQWLSSTAKSLGEV